MCICNHSLFKLFLQCSLFLCQMPTQVNLGKSLVTHQHRYHCSNKQNERRMRHHSQKHSPSACELSML